MHEYNITTSTYNQCSNYWHEFLSDFLIRNIHAINNSIWWCELLKFFSYVLLIVINKKIL